MLKLVARIFKVNTVKVLILQYSLILVRESFKLARIGVFKFNIEFILICSGGLGIVMDKNVVIYSWFYLFYYWKYIIKTESCNLVLL